MKKLAPDRMPQGYSGPVHAVLEKYHRPVCTAGQKNTYFSPWEYPEGPDHVPG